MKETSLLLVFLLVGIVVVGAGGCIQGFHGPHGSHGGSTSTHANRGTSTSTGTSSGMLHTSSSPSSSGPPKGLSLDEVGKLGHVETIDSNGLKGIKTWVDGAVWRGDSRWFNLMFGSSPWFYSNGNLYVFEHNSDNFYAYVESDEEPSYPYYVIHTPIDGVDFTYGGPSGTVVMVDTSGTLHLLVYSTSASDRRYWPDEGSPRMVYLHRILRDVRWELGVRHVTAGSASVSDNSSQGTEYVYYVAWGGKEVYVIPFTVDGLSKLVNGSVSKPKATVFKFNSPVKGAFVGHEAIYVLSGGKVWMIPTLEGETGLKVKGNVDAGDSQVSIDMDGIDAISAYDGSVLKVFLIRNASVVDELEFTLPGFESVQVHVSKTDVSLIAQRGNQLAFYYPSGGRLVLQGYLKLPVRPVWFNGYVSGDAYVTLWGRDGASYMLRGRLLKGVENQTNMTNMTETTSTQSSRETGTSTETNTETTTTTSTPTTLEAELRSFLENSYEVQGIVYGVNGYNYRVIRLTAKTGKFYYYPYGDDSNVYLVSGRHVLRIAPWDSEFMDGDRATPVIDPSDQTLIVLPAVAKLYYSIPNGEHAIMVDDNGELHVLVGLRTVHGSNISWNVFMSNVVYDFDAEGLSIYSYGDYVTYMAWRGKELRLYVYNDDEDYEMYMNGTNVTVEPRVYRLPGRVLEVNPYIDPDFLVVRADDGTYVIPTPYGHYPEDTNVYRIDGYVGFIGIYHYGGVDELIAYSGGRLYTLDVEYSEHGRNVTVKKGSFLSVTNAVGIYGANDREEHVAVSEKDGTLRVYQHVWNDEKGGYEFTFKKAFLLKAPLVRFTFDYRPEQGWMGVMGIGKDGSFYVYEIQQTGE